MSYGIRFVLEQLVNSISGHGISLWYGLGEAPQDGLSFSLVEDVVCFIIPELSEVEVGEDFSL